MMIYRPAALGNGGQYYFMEYSLNKFGYQGRATGQREVELTEWTKESKGSTVTPYALVDPDSATTYAIKVLLLPW